MSKHADGEECGIAANPTKASSLWGCSLGQLKRKDFTLYNKARSQLWCFQAGCISSAHPLLLRWGGDGHGGTRKLQTAQMLGCDQTESICHFTYGISHVNLSATHIPMLFDGRDQQTPALVQSSQRNNSQTWAGSTWEPHQSSKTHSKCKISRLSMYEKHLF